MGMLAVDLLIIHPHVLLLNKRGVGEHKRTQVTGGRRTIDIAFKTHLHHIRNQSGVVDMGMRKHDAVECLGVETKISIGGIGLHSFTLVHTAVQKNGVS